MDRIVAVLLWFSALSSGVMAGIYFAFSFFIMRALEVLAGSAGMAAMQSINRVILRSAFMPLFLGSSLACAALVVIGFLRWSQPGGWQMAAGGAVYLLGMLVVTMASNVPLNNALDQADPNGADAAWAWRRFYGPWLTWNHLRTAACTLSAGLLVWSIVERG